MRPPYSSDRSLDITDGYVDTLGGRDNNCDVIRGLARGIGDKAKTDPSRSAPAPAPQPAAGWRAATRLRPGFGNQAMLRYREGLKEAQLDEERADPARLRQSAAAAQGLALDRVHFTLETPGRELPQPARTEMEACFGADFSRVRVHSNADAATSAKVVHARAYTVGQHIVLAPGEAVSGTAGRALLAHELTHVLQQGVSSVRGPITIGPPGTRAEREADLASDQVAAGLPPRVSRGTEGGALLQRLSDGTSAVAEPGGVTRQPITSARSRDPAALSVAELEREIRILEEWLLEHNASSAERVEIETRVAGLSNALAARQPASQSAGVPTANAGAVPEPERSIVNTTADRFLAGFLSQSDEAQAQFSSWMRGLAASLPPEQFAQVETAIGVVDAIFDAVQIIMMFAVGIEVGSTEVLVETAIGLAKLVWFVVDLLGRLLSDLIAFLLRHAGMDIQLPGESGLDVAKRTVEGLRQLPAAIAAAFAAWQARFQAAPSELKAAMLGRLVPEVTTLLIGGVAAARGARLAVQAVGRTSVVRAIVVGGAIATSRVEPSIVGSGGALISEANATVAAATEARVAKAASTVPVAPRPAAVPVAPSTTAAPSFVAPVASPVEVGSAVAPSVAAPVASSAEVGSAVATLPSGLTKSELAALAISASLAPAVGGVTVVSTTGTQDPATKLMEAQFRAAVARQEWDKAQRTAAVARQMARKQWGQPADSERIAVLEAELAEKIAKEEWKAAQRLVSEMERGKVGAAGERDGRERLEKSGYANVRSFQNASGHGIDLVAEKGGQTFFDDVKTSTGPTAPGLTEDQENISTFVQSRLKQALDWPDLTPEQKADVRALLSKIEDGMEIKGRVIEITNSGSPDQRIRAYTWTTRGRGEPTEL